MEDRRCFFWGEIIAKTNSVSFIKEKWSSVWIVESYCSIPGKGIYHSSGSNVCSTHRKYTKEAVDHEEWKLIVTNRYLNSNPSPLMIQTEKERNKIYWLTKECDWLSFLHTWGQDSLIYCKYFGCFSVQSSHEFGLMTNTKLSLQLCSVLRVV